MKKTIALAAAIAGLALAGCSAQPQAPIAPLMASAQPSASASASPSATPAPSQAAAEHESFMAALNTNWSEGAAPSEADAIAAGYAVCDALDSGASNFGDHILAEFSAVDDALIQWNARAWLCPVSG